MPLHVSVKTTKQSSLHVQVKYQNPFWHPGSLVYITACEYFCFIIIVTDTLGRITLKGKSRIKSQSSQYCKCSCKRHWCFTILIVHLISRGIKDSYHEIIVFTHSVQFIHCYVFQFKEITTDLLTKCSGLIKSGDGLLQQHFQTPAKTLQPSCEHCTSRHSSYKRLAFLFVQLFFSVRPCGSMFENCYNLCTVMGMLTCAFSFTGISAVCLCYISAKCCVSYLTCNASLSLFWVLHASVLTFLCFGGGVPPFKPRKGLKVVSVQLLDVQHGEVDPPLGCHCLALVVFLTVQVFAPKVSWMVME